MQKVIFVPGFVGGKRDFLMLKFLLKKSTVIYFDYNTFLLKPIEEVSKDLDFFIQNLNLKKGEKTKLVGFSAGGLIMDYYLKYIQSSHVDKAVSICTPFNGTYLAWLPLNFLKGFIQMRKNSKFLLKLKRKKSPVKFKTFWCFFDFTVPGKSAKRENPKHTLFFIHLVVQFWPPLMLKVRNFLERI